MLTFAIITACLIYLNAPKKDNFSFLESHYHQTSIHECGHVIVSEILSPGSIERVVLITPERAMWLSLFKRNEGGITYYKDIIKELPKLSSFEIHICRSLGGLAATNVFFPEDKYAGALADINQAKDLIIAIVNNGISEFGVATWDVLTDRQKSTLTNKIMDEQYNRAVKIVLSNKKVIEKMAQELVKSKSMSGEFDRSIIDYHIGLSCEAKDAVITLKNALLKRQLYTLTPKPVIRSDNGPQFISNLFGDTCIELGIEHERIPFKTPNKNAHIESFHAILEGECLSRYEFNSFAEAYETVDKFMRSYNNVRIHSSIKYLAPAECYQMLKENRLELKPVKV